MVLVHTFTAVGWVAFVLQSLLTEEESARLQALLYHRSLLLELGPQHLEEQRQGESRIKSKINWWTSNKISWAIYSGDVAAALGLHSKTLDLLLATEGLKLMVNSHFIEYLNKVIICSIKCVNSTILHKSPQICDKKFMSFDQCCDLWT